MIWKNEKLCFAIMPFAKSFDEIFKYAIKAAAESEGYYCERMDQVAGAINLVTEMIRKIYESHIVVADLTNKSANVFYELGIAHSVPGPNKTIMIVEENEDIPFDIGSFQVLKYTRSYEGIQNLRSGIVERIQFIEKDPSSTNPVQEYRTKHNVKPQLSLHRRDSEEELFNHIYQSQIRVSVLTYLNELTQTEERQNISDICRTLGIQRRKFAVAMLKELEQNGLIVKEKNEYTSWHVSEKGQNILNKLENMIATRIRLTDR